MFSSRVIPKLHDYIAMGRMDSFLWRKGGVPVPCSANGLLSELPRGLFRPISGWGRPVFIVKKFRPCK
jgi:hypothetical protein